MDSQGISIYFEDGYVTTLLTGTNATFHLCPGGESADAPSEPSTKNISLETGTLESQTGNKASGDKPDQSEIMTPFSNIGHHGTTFTVEYGVKSQTTTVKVEQGSVWIRNRFGTPQTIVLTVGQTGEQKSNQAPKLIK